MSGVTNGGAWSGDGKRLVTGSISDINVASTTKSTEEFKPLHDRIQALLLQTETLAESLESLVGRLTGTNSTGVIRVGETARPLSVSTEAALREVASNVSKAASQADLLRRRLYGE